LITFIVNALLDALPYSILESIYRP